MPVRLPIQPERLREKSLLQRYFGEDPKENAFVRCKNLVLSGSLDRRMIEHISSEYEIDVAKQFRDRWRELFREILYHLFEDGVLDASEKEFAKEYVAAFRLEKDNVDSAVQSVGRRVFVERLRRAVGPDGLDKDESARLGEFARQIGLRSKKDAYVEVVSEALSEYLKGMLADDQLSPDELRDLSEMAGRLKVDLVFDSETERLIAAAKIRWRVRNESLARISVSHVRLDRGEDAYHSESVEWYESRKVRLGGVSVDEYKLIYSGELILTDTRLLMLDDLGGSTKTLKWSDLIAVRSIGLHEVELVKGSGKSPLIKFGYADMSPSVGPIVLERLYRQDY